MLEFIGQICYLTSRSVWDLILTDYDLCSFMKVIDKCVTFQFK
jgi:hypothetical protein